jgi:hypothetical protein
MLLHPIPLRRQASGCAKNLASLPNFQGMAIAERTQAKAFGLPARDQPRAAGDPMCAALPILWGVCEHRARIAMCVGWPFA